MADEEEGHDSGGIFGHSSDRDIVSRHDDRDVFDHPEDRDSFDRHEDNDIFGRRESHGIFGRDEETEREEERRSFSSRGRRSWNGNDGHRRRSSVFASLFAAPEPSRPPLPLPDAGSFIPLADPSWEAQAALVKDPRNKLDFDPSRLFDGIVAVKSGIPGLYDPASPDYAKYEGLRTNLAVLRNTLLASGMDAAHMQTMAEALGEGLANDTALKRTFVDWMSGGVAGVEAVGAAEMYKYLLKVQDKPAKLEMVRAVLGKLLGDHDRNWGLPAIEHTPFGRHAPAAPHSFAGRLHDAGMTPLSRA